jgi:GH43 family beta-xylosidase
MLLGISLATATDIGHCGSDVECLSQLNNTIKNTDEKIDKHLDYIPFNTSPTQDLVTQRTVASASSGISESQAIKVARETALANGVRQDWFGGDISTRFINGRWVIHFYSKPDPETGEIMFGNHFTAYVSVDGTIVKFDPGR